MPAIRSIAWILLLAFTSSLIACGSDSGGGKDPQPKPEPEPEPEPDTKPKSFQFPDIEGAEPGEAVTSKPVTITGIDTDVRVEVDKGQYAINDGDFTNKASTLSDGDKLTLKLKASNELVTPRTATVTVGEGSATFTVTTLQDTEAPKATFLFPPPMSATDRKELTIRGTVTDDYSDIESMTLTAYINGEPTPMEVETDDNYATWRATLTVQDGAEHRLVVSTEDSLGNVEENAASVTVHEQAFGEPFPDQRTPIKGVSGLAYDEKRSRVFVSDIAASTVVEISLISGARSLFIGPNWTNEDGVTLPAPNGLAYDETGDRVLVVDRREDSVVSFHPETGRGRVINSQDVPDNNQPEFVSPTGIAIDKEASSAYITTMVDGHLSALGLMNNRRTLVSGPGFPDDENPLVNSHGLIVDRRNNRLIAVDNFVRSVVGVRLQDGKREILTYEESETPTTTLNCPFGIASDDLEKRVLVGDCISGIVAVNTTTGERELLLERLQPSNDNIIHLYAESGWPYVLFAGNTTRGLYALDLETLEHVTISQSQLP